MQCKICQPAEQPQLALACLFSHSETQPFQSSSLHEASVLHTQDVFHLAPPIPSTIKVPSFHIQSQAEHAP